MFWGSQLGALVGVTVEADEVTGIPFWVIKGAGSFRVKSQFPLTHLLSYYRMASAFIQKQEGPQKMLTVLHFLASRTQ